jgi:2-oxo-3-hexenedioate decarboxylase
MITTDIGKWADYLTTAARRNEAVSPITDVEPTLTVEDAYAIQDAIIERRLASGERLVGAKVGLTSRAKQQEMGINEPVYGWLTDAMALEADSSLRLSTLIHPRVEPEIVFILGKALAGPGVGIHDVLDATSAICCGLEVLDSRFIDFRFLLPDVIADNTSASHFVLGTIQVPPTGIDLSLAGCLFEENGAVAATAAGAAILGHPAAAVARLANFLSQRGRHLEAGWIVLSGGLTSRRSPISVERGPRPRPDALEASQRVSHRCVSLNISNRQAVSIPAPTSAVFLGTCVMTQFGTSTDSTRISSSLNGKWRWSSMSPNRCTQSRRRSTSRISSIQAWSAELRGSTSLMSGNGGR